MKKVLFSVSMLVLAGCNNQAANPSGQTTEQAQQEFQEVATAMQSGQSARCVMTNPTTNQSMTYSIKDKKVKMSNIEMNEGDLTGAMLMDGEYLYTWSETKKEGTKFKLPEEKADQVAQEGSVPDLSKEEDRKEYEDMGYTIQCNTLEIADSEFVPPTDVKFTDMNAMMEKMPADSKMTPEQQAEFDKMMEQYKQ